MPELLRTLRIAAVPHGFRSSFRDWAAEATDQPREVAEAAVLVEQWRREYNTVRPHSACGGFPPAPEAIKPSPWFLRMPVLHGPPQVLGLTIGWGTALGGRSQGEAFLSLPTVLERAPRDQIPRVP